jgi:hypothetical protein
VEDFHRGDHHHYDLSNDTAVERRPGDGRETWIDMLLVPQTPPAPAPYPGGPTVGNTRGILNVQLTQVPGNPYRYAYQGAPPQQFVDMVPANYSGNAYKPTLRDSGSKLVPYNPSVWVADGLLSLVEFKYRTPQDLGYTPPFTIDYWQYTGAFAGSGSLANDGAGAQVYEVGTSEPSLLRTFAADPAAGQGGIVITQAPTEILVGNSLTGNNLNPAGVNVGRAFAQKTAALLDFRTLEAGTDVTITETATKIIISALPGVGGLSGLNNEGTGFDVYDVPVGTTALLRRLNPGTGGISIAYAGVSGVNAYLDIDNTLTGANVGAGSGVFRDKTGAALNLRSLIAAAGSGLTLTQNADDITIDAAVGSVATIANEGVGTGQIFDAVVANQANLRTLLADPAAGNGGITISTAGAEVTIGNTLTGASLGGTAAVFANKTGATLNLRGVTAGTGITVTQNATDIVIDNADGASTVTLASAGGTETLVNDGTGPALATKGLSAGTGGISLAGVATAVTIENTLTGASLGGTAAVFANKTGATLNLRGVTAGTNVTVTQNANDITIAAAGGAGVANLTSWRFIDQKANGIDGGASVVGTQTRTLNTTLSSGPSPLNVVLAANLLTVQPGRYYVTASAGAVGGVTHRAALVDNGTGTIVLNGTNGHSTGATLTSRSTLNGVIAPAVATVYRIDHFISSSTAGTGLGRAVGAGVGTFEVYTEVSMIQIG